MRYIPNYLGGREAFIRLKPMQFTAIVLNHDNCADRSFSMNQLSFCPISYGW